MRVIYSLIAAWIACMALIESAPSQLLLLQSGGKSLGATAVWTATANPVQQSGPATSFTFSNVSLGPAGTRLSVVLVDGQTTFANAVTIGGISATQAVAETSGISGLELWTLDTTSQGATANIVVSSASNMANAVIQVAAITGCAATVKNTNSAVSNTNNPETLTVTVPANGFGVGAVGLNSNTTTETGSNATKDFATADGNNVTSYLVHNGTAGSQAIGITNSLSASAHEVVAGIGC